jgi:hypothetical protein
LLKCYSITILDQRGEDYDEFKKSSNLYLLTYVVRKLSYFLILPSGVYEFSVFPMFPVGFWVFMFYITKWEIPCGFGFDLGCNPR